MSKGSIDCSVKIWRAHCVRKQSLEQRLDTRIRRSNVTEYSNTSAWNIGTACRGRHGCQHRPRCCRCSKGFKGASSVRGRFDNHRGQRFTESSLNGGFPTSINRNDIEQSAKYSVKTGKALSAGTSTSSVKGKLERLLSGGEPLDL